MRVLMIGDIVGKAGRRTVSQVLDDLKMQYAVDLTIANAENAASGFGVSKPVYEELKRLGIDVMTSGNHIWDRREIMEILDDMELLLRPANYPEVLPGRGVMTFSVNGVNITLINLIGRVFMPLTDNPFTVFDYIMDQVPHDSFVIVDFHAEATSEKIAFGMYADGRANVVVGTHTHVQTNDDRILSGGSLYLSDLGMCGSLDSVIGMQKEASLERFLTGVPKKFEVEKGGRMVFNALFFEFDDETFEIRSFEKITRITHEYI